jgi:hypothetical protein
MRYLNNHRRRPRFSLRTLFLLVTLAALWLGIALAYWRAADWWIERSASGMTRVKYFASPGRQTTESIIVGLTAALVILIAAWVAIRVWNRYR